MAGITPDAFTATLVAACSEYTEEVREHVENGIKRIGEEALKEVKELAPIYEGDNKNTRKGAYRRSWTCDISKQRGVINAVVHAKDPHYRLTHLLENGHLNRDGTTRSKAIPHISIANASAEKKVSTLLEDIENGTF